MARRIAITGSTGLIGRHLKQHLLARGDQVVQIVRRPAEDVDAVSWLPGRSLDPLEALEGLEDRMKK